jgi:hypothetical protein
MEGKHASSSDDPVPQIHCNPKWAPMCIKFLQDAVVDLLIQASLTKFLYFKSGSVCNRRMCGLLTKNAVVHENSIELRMSDGESL